MAYSRVSKSAERLTASCVCKSLAALVIGPRSKSFTSGQLLHKNVLLRDFEPYCLIHTACLKTTAIYLQKYLQNGRCRNIPPAGCSSTKRCPRAERTQHKSVVLQGQGQDNELTGRIAYNCTHADSWPYGHEVRLSYILPSCVANW